MPDHQLASHTQLAFHQLCMLTQTRGPSYIKQHALPISVSFTCHAQPVQLVNATLAMPPCCLAHCREDVRAHNATALQWHHDHNFLGGPIYQVGFAHDAPTSGPAVESATAFLSAPNFHELTHVALGARIIFYRTDAKDKGATNSKLGTVTGIEFGKPPAGMAWPADLPWVKSIILRLDSGEAFKAERTYIETVHPHGIKISKSTFNVQLAYAMTAHRAQGATLSGTTILDIRSAFASAITYVMLSRATRRSNVFILERQAGGLHPHHDCAVRPVAGAGGAADSCTSAVPARHGLEMRIAPTACPSQGSNNCGGCALNTLSFSVTCSGDMYCTTLLRQYLWFVHHSSDN